MKKLSICLVLLSSQILCFSQAPLDSVLAHIRKLEKRESESLAKGDLKTLYTLWDASFFLHCNSLTITNKQIKAALPQIKFKYDYPSRSFTVYLIDANTAVVMGESTEPYITLPPKIQQTQIEFTDVWSKSTGDWKLCTRQVTYLK